MYASRASDPSQPGRAAPARQQAELQQLAGPLSPERRLPEELSMSRPVSRRKRAASPLVRRERAPLAIDAHASRPPLLPLGAIAAGFGLWGAAAMAQSQPAAPPAAAASAPRPEATLPAVSVKGRAEADNNSVRATTTTIGKGTQEVRDIPQSLTIVTEKL